MSFGETPDEVDQLRDERSFAVKRMLSGVSFKGRVSLDSLAINFPGVSFPGLDKKIRILPSMSIDICPSGDVDKRRLRSFLKYSFLGKFIPFVVRDCFFCHRNLEPGSPVVWYLKLYSPFFKDLRNNLLRMPYTSEEFTLVFGLEFNEISMYELLKLTNNKRVVLGTGSVVRSKIRLLKNIVGRA